MAIESMSERRKAMREQMGRRTEESYDRKDKGGGMYGNILRKDISIKEWICKSDDKNPHVIDIIPYTVGKNPSDKKAKPGDFAYVAEYYVHSGIGANEDRVVCPNKTFDMPCPICEDRKELSDQFGFEDERVKKLKPSRQCVYNVWVYDTAEEEKKGVQIWIVAHWFFERFLMDLAKLPRDGGFVAFADPDEGKQIQFYRKGKENVTFTGHQFINRDYNIPDEILESVYCIEDIVVVHDYDTLATMYYGKNSKTSNASETDETKETGGFSRRAKNEPQGETKVETKVEKPTDNKSTDNKPTCPYGHTIGMDIDQTDQCPNCESYDTCLVISNSNEKRDSKEELQGERGGRRRRY
jgi:hypothetical protein